MQVQVVNVEPPYLSPVHLKPTTNSPQYLIVIIGDIADDCNGIWRTIRLFWVDFLEVCDVQGDPGCIPSLYVEVTDPKVTQNSFIMYIHDTPGCSIIICLYSSRSHVAEWQITHKNALFMETQRVPPVATELQSPFLSIS